MQTNFHRAPGVVIEKVCFSVFLFASFFLVNRYRTYETQDINVGSTKGNLCLVVVLPRHSDVLISVFLVFDLMGMLELQIEEHSSAKASGLNEGDIINQVNGVYISNAAEVCSGYVLV